MSRHPWGVIAGPLEIVTEGSGEIPKMSPRRKTVPPTRVSSRSPQSGRSELIARKKNQKQSAKGRTVLDNRFHRTEPSSPARTRTPKSTTLALNERAGSRPVQRRVRCDVPGRCSVKRVAHPGDFRQSESSSNEQVDRKGPDERAQECAKLPVKSRAAGQTSLRTRMVGARGVGGRRYE